MLCQKGGLTWGQNSFMSLMYQSVPSITISPARPPGIFLWANSPPPGQKGSSKLQPPDLSKQAKTPPLSHFPQLFTIKPEKKSCKIVRFYHL